MKIINPKQLFLELKEEWKAETGGYSISYNRYQNKNIQEIIKMGQRVVPWILEDFRDNGIEYWHYALVEITGENPLKNNSGWEYNGGDLLLIRGIWLKWGKNKGLI